MFIEERHKKILDMLEKNGRIKAREIEEQLGVAFDTARRDLRILEDKGLLKRTHGGAIPLLKVGYRPNYMQTPKDIVNVKENYLKIAMQAITYIKEHDVIYLNSASIGYFMVQNLPTDYKFTLVTNSIIIAEEARKYDNIATYLVGGLMDNRGRSRCHFATEMLSAMRFDKAFLTAAAYSHDFGMSIQGPDMVPITKAVLKNSRTAIGLFPHEKMGQTSIVKICEPTALDIIITDPETTTEEISKIKEMGIIIDIVK